MQTKSFSLAVLTIGCAMYALVSPKLTLPVFAWLWPAFLLYYTRYLSVRKKYLWLLLGLWGAQWIAAEGVIPVPWPVAAIVSIINAGKMSLVFFLDRLITSRKNTFMSTLAFPIFFVAKEAIDAMGAGGSWWVAGNTQYMASWLVQFSSVFGVMGISFMLYWFGSVACRAFVRAANGRKWLAGIIWYAGVLSVILIYGVIYLSDGQKAGERQVKIAGITVPNTLLLDALSKDYYHTGMTPDLRISPSSPQMQKINTALAAFIENPGIKTFPQASCAVTVIEDSLFTLSAVAADSGARIIVWTEAAALVPRFMHDDLVSRAQNFTRQHDVCLLMTAGIFDTGKITPSKMFLENKAVLLGPGGKILCVFHKNFPVPFAERSIPGDGIIPVIETPYGRLAISICYDADMPFNMRQLGQKKADLLLLPSGDWFNIAPYHSYMAMFRGVENSCALFRQASGGLSIASTNTGRVTGSSNYFGRGERMWMTDMPIAGQDTLFNKGGYLFPDICIGTAIILLIVVCAGKIKHNIRTAGRFPGFRRRI